MADTQSILDQIAARRGVRPEVLRVTLQGESGGRTSNVPAGDGGKSLGPFQIQIPTLEDANRTAGTDYQPQDLTGNFLAAADVAAITLANNYKEFGNWPAAAAAYMTGVKGLKSGNVSPDVIQRSRASAQALGLPSDPVSINEQLGITNSYGLVPPGHMSMDTFAPIIGRMEQNQAESERVTAPIREGMMKQLGEDMARVHKAADAVEPVDIQKWTLPPPKNDPVDGFSSIGAIFAGIASAFTHTPAINAMNGMAAAIEARNQGNQEAYKQAYQAWKDNTQLAIDRQRIQSKAFTDALELMQTDVAAGHAALMTASSVYGDRNAMLATEAGMYGKVAEANAAADRTAMLLGVRMRQIEAGGAPGSPGYVTNQIYNQIKKDHPEISDGDAWKEAERQQQKIKTQTDTGFTPEEKESGAAQAATGMPLTQIAPGYGQAAVQFRRQLRNDAIKKIQDETGMSAAEAGTELANRTIEFQSGKASSRQLTVMLGATKQAVEQLDFNIQKAKEEMAKLPSSDLSPAINAIARGEEKWTGDPAYASTFFYLHAVAAESARILSGGQASIAQLHEGAMQEAQQWASINMTPASFDSVATAMREEGKNRLQNFESALKSQRLGQQPSAPGDTQAPAGLTPAKTEGGSAIPPRPASLAGKPLEWNADLKQFRDTSTGKVYRADGTPGG